MSLLCSNRRLDQHIWRRPRNAQVARQVMFTVARNSTSSNPSTTSDFPPPLLLDMYEVGREANDFILLCCCHHACLGGGRLRCRSRRARRCEWRQSVFHILPMPLEADPYLRVVPSWKRAITPSPGPLLSKVTSAFSNSYRKIGPRMRAVGVRDEEEEDLSAPESVHAADGGGIVVFDGVGAIQLRSDVTRSRTAIDPAAQDVQHDVQVMSARVVHRTIEHRLSRLIVLPARPAIAAVVAIVARPAHECRQTNRCAHHAGVDVRLERLEGCRERPLISDRPPGVLPDRGRAIIRSICSTVAPQRLLAEDVAAVL